MSSKIKRRENEVNKALYREPLLFGCNRAYFLSVSLVFILVCYITADIVKILIAFCFTFLLLFTQKELNKRDRFLFKSYLNAITYKRIYLAKSNFKNLD